MNNHTCDVAVEREADRELWDLMCENWYTVELVDNLGDAIERWSAMMERFAGLTGEDQRRLCANALFQLVVSRVLGITEQEQAYYALVGDLLETLEKLRRGCRAEMTEA